MYASTIQSLLEGLKQQSQSISSSIESSSSSLLNQVRSLDESLRDESNNLISLKSIQDALTVRQDDGTTALVNLDHLIESIAATDTVTT